MIVDDQTVVRRGLRMSLILEPDICVIAEAANGLEAIEIARQAEPDVVIMDVEMPSMDGFEATAWLLSEPQTAPVVIIHSMHDHAEVRSRAITAGAFAFIPKHAPLEDLIAAIRKAADSTADSQSIAQEAA